MDAVVDGFMDWLFVEDPGSREFAELGQAMYRHYFDGGTGAVLWSIIQQAMRQDLGLYVLAVTTHPSGQTTLVTHNLPTDATQYRADISLTGEPGDLRFAFARPEVRLHGLKVSTSWVDVRDDCHNLTDSKLGSWADLTLSNAKATEFPAPAFGGVRPGGCLHLRSTPPRTGGAGGEGECPRRRSREGCPVRGRDTGEDHCQGQARVTGVEETGDALVR